MSRKTLINWLRQRSKSPVWQPLSVLIAIITLLAPFIIGYLLGRSKPPAPNRLIISSETAKDLIEFPGTVSARTKILIDGVSLASGTRLARAGWISQLILLAMAVPLSLAAGEILVHWLVDKYPFGIEQQWGVYLVVIADVLVLVELTSMVISSRRKRLSRKEQSKGDF